MPLYEYVCNTCTGATQVMSSIDDRKLHVPCQTCGKPAGRVIGSQILRTEPTWLDSAKRSLQPDDREQIRDRNDLNAYMKKEGVDQIG